MSIIEIKQVSNHGFLEYPGIGRVRDRCFRVSMQFETGNVYCLDSNLTGGGWAISWLLAGNLRPMRYKKRYYTNVFLDGEELSQKELEGLGFTAGLTGFEGTFSINKPVGKLLDRLVKNSPRVSSVKELEELFMLSDALFDRPIKCYSNERWGVSIAMGYARGKRVFCFPWLRPEFVIKYKDLWIKRVLKILVEADCLVIIPTLYKEDMSDLFTKVAMFDTNEGLIDGGPIELKEFPDSYK